jgi:cAMP-dependent protein kinase regulator
MIDYLQEYGGYNKALNEKEKYELDHLRAELRKFKEIEDQENKEVEVSDGSDSESQSGSPNQSKSEDKSKSQKDESENENEKEDEKEDEKKDEKSSKSGSLVECVNESKNKNESKNENKSKSHEESVSGEADDEDSQLGDLSKQPVIKKKNILPRAGVSAEVYGEFNKKEDFVARNIPKTDEQIQRIKSSVIHSFLFSNLEPKDLEIVIGAMDEKRFKPGEDVITQGDKGDCLYFVESGNLECYKQFSKGEEPVLVKKYEPGDSFGELALLYNAPRAATIRTVNDVITWVLDRETFNNIVKDAAQKKREKYENFLKNVEILSTIDSYEIMQISDAIKSAIYKKGDYIIKEGEIGDIFYILEEGECVATKTLEPGKPETVIKEYGVGGYFGERALIKGEPRAANIIVKSDEAKVISLDRTSFKRLLGPIEELLKRNIEKYQTFVGNSE